MFLLTTLIYVLDVFWFFYQTRLVLLQAVSDLGITTPLEVSEQLKGSLFNYLIVVECGAWFLSVCFSVHRSLYISNDETTLKMFLGDSILVWRAKELSSGNGRVRRIALVPLTLLLAFICTCDYGAPRLLLSAHNLHHIGTASYAVSCMSRPEWAKDGYYFLTNETCRASTVASLSLSLTTNLCATCIIAFVGW